MSHTPGLYPLGNVEKLKFKKKKRISNIGVLDVQNIPCKSLTSSTKMFQHYYYSPLLDKYSFIKNESQITELINFVS